MGAYERFGVWLLAACVATTVVTTIVVAAVILGISVLRFALIACIAVGGVANVLHLAPSSTDDRQHS
jgi:hypothetical protein